MRATIILPWSSSLLLLSLSLQLQLPFLMAVSSLVPGIPLAEAANPTKLRSSVSRMAVSKLRGGVAGKNDRDRDHGTSISRSLIEENPEYAADSSDDDGDGGEDSRDSDSDGDSDGDSDDADGAAKDRVSKSLKKTRKRTNKSSGALEAFRKNRLKITLALAVFAFRNEILAVLLKLYRGGQQEPPNPIVVVTGALKLILFAVFMRKLQTGGGTDAAGLLQWIGRASPLLGIVIEKTMNHNPAYVPPIAQHFAFESLNEYYLKDGMALHKAIHTRHEGFRWPGSSTPALNPDFVASSKTVEAETTAAAAASDSNDDRNQTVVILDWTKLDTSISSLEVLRQQVGFLMSEYRSLAMRKENENGNAAKTTPDNADESPSPSPLRLEVVVLLESPGGSVAEYGLAGQHLLRLRNQPGITLTICVDKVAASGGYLLCCTASPGKLFASPFALLGSIGVIGTQINVNKFLTDRGIEPLEFRGGKDKAPIGLLGPVSEEGKRTTQAMIDQTHRAFKEHVANARPVLGDTIDEIGNGNVWLGKDALDKNLIDAIKTSDDYIEEKIRNGGRVFKMVRVVRSGFLLGPRITSSGQTADLENAFLERNPSSAAVGDDLEGLIRRSGPWMARLPVRQFRSLVHKTMRYFQ